MLGVHCYICDEEVQDVEIAKHLNNFGIKVENQVKTEKSISELVFVYFIVNYKKNSVKDTFIKFEFHIIKNH